MFRHAYAIFSLIEWQVICDTSYTLHNMSKLFTILGPLLLPEHRPPITTFQSPLSWAILSSCFHLCPVLLMFFSSSRRQVFRDLPLFLWPWGFRFGAWRPMLLIGGLRSVWPSQLHLLCRMSSSTGVCCLLARRFSLLIVSGWWILSILRKHWLIRVWIFFIDALVVRHVSAPYNNTHLTFELNTRTLVDVPISLELQTFF